MSNSDANPNSVSDSRRRRKRNRGEEVTSGTSTTDKKATATPSRRRGETVRTAAASSPLENAPVVGSLVRYFRGVMAEMQKVTWPTQQETIQLTQVVLYVTIFFAVSLGVLDAFYGWWFRAAIENNLQLFLVVAAVVSVFAGGLVYYLFYRREETIRY